MSKQLARAKDDSHDPDNRRAAALDDLQQRVANYRTTTCSSDGTSSPNTSKRPRNASTPLDTWRGWANGKPIDRERLVVALTSLREHASHEPADGTQRWAAKQGIELQPARRPAIEPIGIELDL